MRKTLLAAMLAASFGISGGVEAANLYSNGNPATGPYLPPNNWAGFYGGVNGGYAWNTGSDVSHVAIASDCGGLPGCIVGVPLVAKKATTSPEGGFGGGQVGYNWQASRWVFGLETDIQGASLNRTNSLTNGLPIGIDIGSSSLDWFGTVRGRLGFTIFDSALLYATGGFAYGGVEDKTHAAFVGGSHKHRAATKRQPVTSPAPVWNTPSRPAGLSRSNINT
jgi:outer membrane immunogenic protein